MNIEFTIPIHSYDNIRARTGAFYICITITALNCYELKCSRPYCQESAYDTLHTFNGDGDDLRNCICVSAKPPIVPYTRIQSVEYNLSRIYSRHRSIETDTGTGDLWKTFMKVDAEDAHVKEAPAPIPTPGEFDARTRGTVKIAWIEV